MQALKSLGAVLVLGVFVAACGGNAATQAPGATQGGGGATQQPAATTDTGPGATEDGGGNGGGTIGFQYGKVKFTATGPVAAEGEYGFLPSASMFGGSAGSIFNFASSAESDAKLLNISVNSDGSVTVSLTGASIGQIPGSTCTTSDWNVGSTSASGKFDCKSALSISASGAVLEGSSIKGEFTAHT